MKIKRFKVNDIGRGRIAVADTFALRLRGLLGRDFRYFDALILQPCSEIHTCFMPYPIDVLFLSRSRQIIRIEENIPPWTLYAGEKGAWCVVELPAGRAGDWGLRVGDWVELF